MSSNFAHSRKFNQSANPNQLVQNRIGDVGEGVHDNDGKKLNETLEMDGWDGSIDRADPNSEVFSWGCDKYGQLGLGEDIHLLK